MMTRENASKIHKLAEQQTLMQENLNTLTEEIRNGQVSSSEDRCEFAVAARLSTRTYQNFGDH